MAVFYAFFRKLSGAPGGVPYAVFALAALVPWTFFANAISTSSLSLVSDIDLISKVYFPRLSVPIASVVAGLVDLGLSFVLLMVLTFAEGFAPTWPMLAVVPLTARGRGGGRRDLLPARRPVDRVPRLPLRRPLRHAAVAVRHAGRLRHVGARSAVADAVGAEPDGRRRHRLPVGAARRRRRRRPERAHLDRVGVALAWLGVWWFHRREPVFADVA